MRPPSLSWTWCSGTSWSSVAEYTLTGTLTRPNVMAPFQMALIRPWWRPARPPARGGGAGSRAGDARGPPDDAARVGGPRHHGRVAGTRFEFEAELWRWEARTDSWVFAALPEDVSDE